MVCEKCKKNDATVHLTEVVENSNREVHLCDVCARQMGLNTGTSGFSLSVPEMLTFLNVNDVSGESENSVCLSCGLKYTDFRRTGKLGCPECYSYFTEVNPLLEKSFSKGQYAGKIPENTGSLATERVAVKSEIRENNTQDSELLQSMLDEAISEERYEDAAEYRDRLNKKMNTKQAE